MGRACWWLALCLAVALGHPPVALQLLSDLACPYSASFLAHRALLLRVRFWVRVRLMEEVFYGVLGRASHKFQPSDPDAFFVHHLSEFEHRMHAAHGFEAAQRMTDTMARAAASGECGNLSTPGHAAYLAVVPFYGGLPPNVSAHKVLSTGEGNSLARPEVKALQLLAALCSALRECGRAVVGVTCREDAALVLRQLGTLPPAVRAAVLVVHLNTSSPALLPPSLLVWTQRFIARPPSNARPLPHGEPAEELARWGSVQGRHVRLVYYSEADQLLRVRPGLLGALSAASNSSCLFVPRRRHKRCTPALTSDPSMYMHELEPGNLCGLADRYELVGRGPDAHVRVMQR